ncbi:MAG: manganese efflux pump MntP family protein [Vicinamibacterales bacterium]
MTAIETILVAIGLAMDAFAVALGAATSARPMAPRAGFRLPFHFGLFQAIMPVAGWLVGARITVYVAAVDHWLAFALLGFVGARMIHEGVAGEEGAGSATDPSKGWTLIVLSLAVSIDALAVGFSLAMLGVDIWYPAVAIGMITGSLTLIGMRVGQRLGRAFGRAMETAGGLVLFGIGARILIQHMG